MFYECVFCNTLNKVRYQTHLAGVSQDCAWCVADHIMTCFHGKGVFCNTPCIFQRRVNQGV